VRVRQKDLSGKALNCYRWISRALPTLEEDDRVLPMLEAMAQQGAAMDVNVKMLPAGSISASQVDEVQVSFPMCMRSMHSALRSTHHLRHWGRMQYGLFLKVNSACCSVSFLQRFP
jgi:DNA primase large subunit